MASGSQGSKGGTRAGTGKKSGAAKRTGKNVRDTAYTNVPF